MKVTVTFGDTAVVVPCKGAWTVRDLIDQATRRYRRILEQHEQGEVKTHHLKYMEGGILDMDDLLSDLVEDRDRLAAVFDVQRRKTDSPRETISNGYSSSAHSPEPAHYYPHLGYQEPVGGEIEVNEASLKANTPLLVRSSSDSALAPPLEIRATPPPDDHGIKSPEPEINNVLKGALDRLRTDDPPAKMSHVNYSTLTRVVEFPGDWAPLGIHVIPYSSSLSGRTLGLHIKGIEENSRSKRENLFQQDECIVQINDTPLQDKTFSQSQEVFRQAMSSPTVHLEVLPSANKPRYEKSLIGQLFTGDGKDATVKAKSPMTVRAKTALQPEPKQDTRPNGKLEVRRPDTRVKTPDSRSVNTSPAELQSGYNSSARVSPTLPGRAASSSPTPRTRSQSPLDSRSPVPGLANLTSRRGSGKRIKIDLKKGTEGLGFTVVTRDASVHGPGPILVKNILPRGAAVKDGRLQPGDRILEVNGVDMTGRNQEELVGMLRSTRQGESVSVVVARQEDIFLPRELKGEEDGSLVLEDGREQLMYEIPLNESGSAGLGVSLKGNKSRETGEDLGIFIKSIIHGGAAYKDGRLNVNDQMIAVNGESLLGRSNHTAMETLRRSMSSEGTARGTIQLVVLRVPRQMASGNPAPNAATNGSATQQQNNHKGSSNQEPWGHNAYQGPSRPPITEPTMNGASHTPVTTNNYAYGNSGSAPHPATPTSNGSYGHYGNADDDLEESFPSPPSPGTVEEMNRDSPLTLPRHSEFQKREAAAFYAADDKDNAPRNRASKSMDLVADESNMGSLSRQTNESPSGGALGPTLGLMKSSSLESLQTAVSEAKQSRSQARVPFHRPRPHMVRGRGCNQSFRIAIDKSYEGPSEDDDDMSEHSSGRETPVSSSSRQGLDADDGKKKKTKGKKKEKKSKGRKKTDDSADDPEKKTKKKGFNLLRFGKKKDDKSKDAAKASKSKLEALSEEEQPERGSYDPRYAEIHSGNVTPDTVSFPDVEDDDSDPNYARINNFRQPPSPQSYASRTPSPAALTGGPNPLRASAEELDGLYAKVNKSRPPPALQNQHQPQADSDQRLQGLRREYQQARAAPGYDELDSARRRALEHDPNRMAPRGAESRPAPRYDEVDRQYPTHPRRDPYDYPTHSRAAPREAAPYPGYYNDPSAPSHPSRVQQSHQAPSNPRHNPSSQHHASARQDMPPSPTAGRRGRNYYEAAGGRVDAYRNASPGRYTSPERHPDARERYTSPERYGDVRQPDPRRKNPMIGAV
ncbi:LOW QUALITY PROTEIN: par-3 family cell polarity regulator beta a [Sebastes umbrosus]|uniref:LOW QUALITY PROTEIN: par-3 family cell polarity regulator beta a n=1 Tax=Sebastes umbrosus TaxID=72105 RepID=UPI00189E5B9A|nr:LOW QUALITY PROTEIN: par-3 family cell polarity regulator beta a [Sebastes umbrosus]